MSARLSSGAADGEQVHDGEADEEQGHDEGLEVVAGAVAGDSEVLAGGHSLLPLMKLRLAAPADLTPNPAVPATVVTLCNECRQRSSLAWLFSFFQISILGFSGPPHRVWL